MKESACTGFPPTHGTRRVELGAPWDPSTTSLAGRARASPLPVPSPQPASPASSSRTFQNLFSRPIEVEHPTAGPAAPPSSLPRGPSHCCFSCLPCPRGCSNWPGRSSPAPSVSRGPRDESPHLAWNSGGSSPSCGARCPGSRRGRPRFLPELGAGGENLSHAALLAAGGLQQPLTCLGRGCILPVPAPASAGTSLLYLLCARAQMSLFS